MKCLTCKQGETRPGATTLTFVRPLRTAEATIVLKHVPAQVCSNCGEAYLDETVSRTALRIAEDAIRGGTEIEVRDFAAVTPTDPGD